MTRSAKVITDATKAQKIWLSTLAHIPDGEQLVLPLKDSGVAYVCWTFALCILEPSFDEIAHEYGAASYEKDSLPVTKGVLELVSHAAVALFVGDAQFGVDHDELWLPI